MMPYPKQTYRYQAIIQHPELFREQSSWLDDFNYQLIGTYYYLVLDGDNFFFRVQQKSGTLEEIWDDLPEEFQNFFMFNLDLFR